MDYDWLGAAVAIMLVVVAVWISSRNSSRLQRRIKDLETSLRESLDRCGVERQGRVKAQQALREAFMQHKKDQPTFSSYLMEPIGVVSSCFSTRNGTPRQSHVVPLARALVVLNSSKAPPESLEGLSEYSHCWLLYVFHLNTNMEKLWKAPSRSKLKAKVRVPRLKGGKMGLFATRSPHRPCPIGLSVAKVEAVSGCTILLSGVDLVDGTPLLDIKPYLPYSDNVFGATVPSWLLMDNSLAVASVRFSADFAASVASCWERVGNSSLYSSLTEFQSLIHQVLSWDIRSATQRLHPRNSMMIREKQGKVGQSNLDCDFIHKKLGTVVYHLIRSRYFIHSRCRPQCHCRDG